MLRLNTAIASTTTRDEQSRSGVIGGDAGFPNGRHALVMMP